MTPNAIDRWIRRGVLWSAIVAVADALLGLVVALGADLPMGRYSGYDALLYSAMAWGVSRRNRIAAVALPAYWLYTKWLLWLRFHRWGAVVGAAVLGYVFVRAAHAVFAAPRPALEAGSSQAVA